MLETRQLARRRSSAATRYRAAIDSTVSPACTVICAQPAGIEQPLTGSVEVAAPGTVGLGVTDCSAKVAVEVLVSGMGEGSRLLVAVGMPAGLNSTSDMESAPTIRP